jgi:O-succinylbenzoate synthase
VAACLRIAEDIALPVVVSSALETSVGIAAGLALAAALPELPYACGLATLSLLAGDVTSEPFRVVDGALAVRRAEPDCWSAVAADGDTDRRWRDRLTAVRLHDRL